MPTSVRSTNTGWWPELGGWDIRHPPFQTPSSRDGDRQIRRPLQQPSTASVIRSTAARAPSDSPRSAERRQTFSPAAERSARWAYPRISPGRVTRIGSLAPTGVGHAGRQTATCRTSSLDAFFKVFADPTRRSPLDCGGNWRMRLSPCLAERPTHVVPRSRNHRLLLRSVPW